MRILFIECLNRNFMNFQNGQNSINSLIQKIPVQIIGALPTAVLSTHTPAGLMLRPVSAPITNAIVRTTD